MITVEIKLFWIFFFVGLLSKWYSEVEHAIILHQRTLRRDNTKSLRVFTLIDVQTAFYILIIGLFLCLIVFAFEIFLSYGHRIDRK